jgi:hypothetical protein
MKRTSNVIELYWPDGRRARALYLGQGRTSRLTFRTSAWAVAGVIFGVFFGSQGCVLSRGSQWRWRAGWRWRSWWGRPAWWPSWGGVRWSLTAHDCRRVRGSSSRVTSGEHAMSEKTTVYRDAQGRTDAERACDKGAEYPYDGHRPEQDWAHKAARGVLYDLSDRGGIKHVLRDVEYDVRIDIVDSLAAIIREADRRRTL